MVEIIKDNQEQIEKTPLKDGLDEEALMKKALEMSPEAVKSKLEILNRRVQLSGTSHEVAVIADPKVTTWSCARVPKNLAKDGKEVVTTDFVYIITLPFHHIAIDEEEFILGELNHELGHAYYTDWRANQRLVEFAKKQGYPGEVMGMLTNCLEDPHMENVSANMSPLHAYKRKWFWAKNKSHILPNIGNNLATADPVSQFALLLKLYSLWEIHKKDADIDNVLLWDGIKDLNPDVKEAWERIKKEIEEIVGIGQAKRPIVLTSKIEKIIKKKIWPEYKALIDKYGIPEPPEDEDGDFPGKPGKGKGEGKGKGKGKVEYDDDVEVEEGEDEDGNSQGEPGKPKGKVKKIKIVEGSGIHDPENIDDLPPEVKKLIEKYLNNRKKKVEKEAKKQQEDAEKRANAKKNIEDEKNKKLNKLDGMTAEYRQEYNEIFRDAKPIVSRLSRIFERYFPKVTFPRDRFGRKGKKYVHKKHIKAIGTGLEKPLSTPNIPQKAGLVLQIIVDVSGSMYHNKQRMEQSVKTLIAILEASKDYPVHIEILASSDTYGEHNPEYIIKSFNEEFSGRMEGIIKTRLVKLNRAEGYGGGNSTDDDVLKWGIPRMVKEKKDKNLWYERVAALAVVLTDVEMDDQQDPTVVNDMRKLAPIIGGIVGTETSIKKGVQNRFGRIGEGSFCPDNLMQLPQEFENVIRRRIQLLFR